MSGEVTWDIGASSGIPLNESTIDLGYGISGIGIFLIEYARATQNIESKKICQLIWQRIVNSVTFISDKIIIPQTSVSPNGFFGLSNGLAGNMLFIDEYSSYTDNKAASEIVNQIITTLYKTNTVGFNVATGYAGILLALSKISFTNNKTEILKQRLNNLLVEGVCTQNGKCSWSNSLSIDNNDNSFLTGSLGIIHTLKGASYTK